MMLSVPAINSSSAANTTRPAPLIPYLLELIPPLSASRDLSIGRRWRTVALHGWKGDTRGCLCECLATNRFESTMQQATPSYDGPSRGSAQHRTRIRR